MKYAPMRFDGLSLRHSPEKLIIDGKNHIREYTSPCCRADSNNLGAELCRVSGEGELCGADCIAQYQALEKLQKTGKRSKLVLPHMQPIYAYLKELSLTAKPVDHVISYRFVFVEAQSPRMEQSEHSFYVTQTAGENLWDISYSFRVAIEQLIALNPQIPFIDELNKGERVRLCCGA